MSYDVYWAKNRAEKLRILNTLPEGILTHL